MRKMAYSSFGRNALVAGLICHTAAIVAGMLSASGNDAFFKTVYPLSWLLLIAGAYAELRQRGIRPVKTWRFYLIAIASVFPLLGPLVILALISGAPESHAQTDNRAGRFLAMLNLRANRMIVLVVVLLLFLLFVFFSSHNDPYFHKRDKTGFSAQLHPACG